VGGADGVHGRDPHGAHDGTDGGHDGQDQPQRGPPGEHADLEVGDPDRHREHRCQDPGQRGLDGEPDAHAEGHAEQRHLHAHQQRPGGQLRGGDPHGHADADLPTLGLDDAAGQVERGEGGTEEDQEREDVVEALVAVDVVVEHPQHPVLVLARGRRPDAGQGGGQRLLDRRLPGLGRHPLPVGDDEVVGLPVHAGEPPDGLDGRPQHGVAGLAEDRPLRRDDHEVLGGQHPAHVPQR
jgi:hypothetical protein